MSTGMSTGVEMEVEVPLPQLLLPFPRLRWVADADRAARRNTMSERVVRGEFIRRDMTRRWCTASSRARFPPIDVQHIGSALVGSGVRSVGVNWSNRMATTA
uniref:Uncharacterized protein n=1 Tax=Setaria viridis TaxID=4556 RepID=A0A4U6W348_SETVI|nr:hypothetical protein SEVIR_2G417300v2 [Setaria viridis]